ncbi:hypothetical protein K474DRAFT_1637905 [Panus rudis PR-1116 ss-1]|nr:hypothetical protein K474DRAFT_1637905 [Panus rudis PR-1116 ss-1]
MLRNAAGRVGPNITLKSLRPRTLEYVRAFSATVVTFAPPGILRPSIRSRLSSPEVKDVFEKIPPLPEAARALSAADADTFNAIIPSLQNAIVTGDMKKASSIWFRLSPKMIEALGPPSLDTFSRSIASWCKHHVNGKIDMQTWHGVEVISLATASGGYPEGLIELMLLHIGRHNSEAVLKLYGRYFFHVQESNAFISDAEEGEGEQPSEQLESSSLSLEEREEQMVVSHLPFVHTAVLLSAVTAFAMQNRFRDALRTTLQTRTRITPTNLKGFLRRLPPDSPLREQVSQYATQIDLARLLKRRFSLSTHLANLARDRADKSLATLYTNIVRELSSPNSFVTLNPTKVGSSVPFLAPDNLWASFLTAFLRVRRLDLAERVWDDMARLGVISDAAVWTALLDGYTEMGPSMVDRALASWNLMREQGITPEPLTYRALINGLFLAGEINTAKRYFEEFQRERSKLANVQDSTVLLVYNTVLHGLLFNSKEDEAQELLQRMRDHGPHPDIVSFNTFMRYYSRKDDLRSIASILQMIDAEGLAGDAFTFSTLLRVLLKVRKDAMEMVFKLMEKQGVKPNAALYTGIIDHLLQQDNAEDVVAAMELLTKMEQDASGEITPNQITYTNILTRILRATWLDPGRVEEYESDILRRMKERNITPTRVMYNLLIKASLDNPEPQGLHNALRYYRDMMAQRVLPSGDTWYNLLHGVVRRGEWSLAHELVDEMDRTGFVPAASLSSFVTRIRHRARAEGKHRSASVL